MIFGNGLVNVKIEIAKNEDLSDLSFPFGFSLSGFSVTAKANVNGQVVDLLPTINSDTVNFNLAAATTNGLNAGRGYWDLYLTDGSSVPRKYVEGEFVLNEGASTQ